MEVGETIRAKGFITRLHFLRKKKGSQLERLLGYKAGRLGFGWAMLYLNKLPKVSDFEFRGYSQMSGGISMGHLENPLDKRTAETKPKDCGYDVLALKRAIIKNTFAVSGVKRLVKVIPNKPPSGSKDDPPGSGIPQWELTKTMDFTFAAVIPPNGESWQTA